MKRYNILTIILLFLTQMATAQFGYETIEDNYLLNGPVYLYKKTVLKDYVEKFGKYEPNFIGIEEWFLYDEKRRKIFEHKDKTKKGRKTAYERTIFYFNGDKLMLSANTFTIGNVDDNYRFKYYKYPQVGTMEEYFTSYTNKLVKGFTKKYNSKKLLLEASEYLGDKGGYKKVYKYDNKDKKVSYTEYNGIGDVEQKILFKGDGNGNLLERTIYNSAGKLWGKTVFKYNSAGKETENIEYGANGKERSKAQTNYLDDTLKTYYIAYWEGKISHELKIDYDNKKRKEKVTFIYYFGEKINKYTIFSYDSYDNLVEQKTFKNKKLTEKGAFSNYSGRQNLSYSNETYNEDGSLKQITTINYDKYGNTIAYEKYKYEIKFGESVKIPIEKYKIDVLYHNGTPKLSINVQVVKEKHKNSKGKKIKADYLKITFKNATTKPKIHLYDKLGITHSGGSKPNLHKSGYNFSFQYDYIKRFFQPYIIVEAGNEVIVAKLPYE